MPRILGLGALALGLLGGCAGGGPGGPPAPTDEEAARQLIVAALDAWKQGKAGELSRRAPPIRFVDEDRSAGMKLADYEPPGAPRGRDFPVVLSLRDTRGRAVRREARYQVVTGVAPAVLRSDE